jgi:hypothetical protein
MKKDSIYVKNSVDNLRDYATSKGLKLVFRNTPTNAGDFCFFIYKMTGGSYLVGYDGYWNVDPRNNVSFDRCWDAAHKFISNYDRF